MSVGVPLLDSDHKTLLGLINHLQRSIGDDEEHAAVGSVLQALEEYAAHHFAREEAMMDACRYPLLTRHHGTHAQFTEKVLGLKSRYDQDQTGVRARECLAFLNSWLIDHICTTDMNYRSWMIGHPGAEAAAQKVSMTGAVQKGADLDWARLRILLVDDNVNFLEILRTILQSVGVTKISAAHDLEAAKAVISHEPLDMLLSDWHVGQESGLDLVRWVRRGPPDQARLPVLVLSGHERMANRDLALLAGADEFMEKPISARNLLLGVARLAGRAA
ncbi:Hemerythrin [Paramagnetospirillum magnetotacticum MS-1]|uniref:Hemerythrin n=2 Tax=Paramagnetospirillum magnetotacticum TaxID=188 RepID=A0A0C2YW74_PARME|nr:Hemerythrin [Paramagnetospirillum magnetotacticum MS-1]